VTVFSARPACGTPQLLDEIFYRGKSTWILECPLESLLWKSPSQHPNFDPSSTANHKGYCATWEIRDGRLFLIGLEATVDGKPFRVDRFVKGAKLPVLARWYTGKVHVVTGKLLGFAGSLSPKFETIDVLEIWQGRVIHRRQAEHAGREAP
jgi:hypothetical protein